MMSGQQLFLGVGAIGEMANVIGAAQPRRILLVTGRNSYRDSGAERALSTVLARLDVVRFDAFSINPTLTDVERGISVCRLLRPDIVIAVGGGSAMDTAKAINVLAPQHSSLAAILSRTSLVVEPPKPLIAVPTTAGSGSEATRFSTIYVDGVKHSLAHEWLRPQCAIVDPTLTASMPSLLTAITGLDALSQAIESYWSVGASRESLVLAEQAIRKIYPTLIAAVRRPTETTRSAMAEGAYLAGCAIDISRTTAPHALSYVLTSRYGVPHGLAVALTLGAFFEHNVGAHTGRVNDPRGADYVAGIMKNLCAMLGCQTPGEAAAAWSRLLAAVGVPSTLQSAGIKADDLVHLTREVNAERLANHPVRISPEDIREIFGRAMGRA